MAMWKLAFNMLYFIVKVELLSLHPPCSTPAFLESEAHKLSHSVSNALFLLFILGRI